MASQGLIDNVLSLSRTLYGRATFSTFYNSEQIGSSYNLTVSNTLSSHRTYELNDKIMQQEYRIASAEKNMFRLDGKTRLHVDNSNYKFGYVSSAMSNASGIFVTPISINFNFAWPYQNANSVFPVGIVFDQMHGGYSKNFDIIIKYVQVPPRPNDVIEVRDNKEVFYNFLDIQSYANDRTEIEIKFYDWSKPNERLRLAECDFFAFRDFSLNEDDRVLKFSLSSELDFHLESMPGSSASLELENMDYIFNPLYEEGIARFLNERTVISLHIGSEVDGNIEYEKIGTVFLKNWESEGFRAKFELQDLIQVMNEQQISITNLDDESTGAG